MRRSLSTQGAYDLTPTRHGRRDPEGQSAASGGVEPARAAGCVPPTGANDQTVASRTRMPFSPRRQTPMHWKERQMQIIQETKPGGRTTTTPGSAVWERDQRRSVRP